jgi:hypothetical protein
MYRLDFKYHRAYAKNCNLKKADEQIKKLKPGVITNKELQQVIGSVLFATIFALVVVFRLHFSITQRT